MSLKLLPNEPVVEFLEQFRRVSCWCNVQLPESKYTTVVVNNMHTQLIERLVAIKYSNLAQLISSASRVE